MAREQGFRPIYVVDPTDASSHDPRFKPTLPRTLMMPPGREPSLAPTSAPQPPLRSRKPTTRKQQLVDEVQAKEAAKAHSVKKSLLQAKQSLAEANDYEDELEYESEDEPNELNDSAFLGFTTAPVAEAQAQPKPRPKPTLVRRVGSGKENQLVMAPPTINISKTCF